jgi:uncharacterized membrane protein
MNEARHDDSKESFQLERLILFTDAVFAIAITLLIIEIKVPVLETFTDHALLESLAETPFKFLGFLLSFGIIGHYWAVHHRIFGYVKKHTPALFWVNLVFLFFIVTLPFSSALAGEFSSHTEMQVPYIIYSVNMFLVGLINCLLWLFVSNPKRDLLTRKISQSRIRLGFYRSLVVPVIFLISMFASFAFPLGAKFLLLLAPVILHWGMRGLERRADKHEAAGEIHH